MNKYIFTETWNGFQIRGHTENKYDLVKWHYKEKTNNEYGEFNLC